MGTTLATKSDLLLIRQEIENRYGLLSREIAAVRTDVNKDLQILRSDVNKDLHALRSDVNKDLQALRSEMGKDMEALRLSMTLRLGSMLMVGVGVILAAFRLWL